MQFKIFSAPGDHRDDFGQIQSQLNGWAATEGVQIIHLNMAVTAMTDERNAGRYLLTILVAYESARR